MNSRDLKITAAAGVFAAACAWGAVAWMDGADIPPEGTFRLGERLPALRLEALGGGALESANWQGRTVLLNVWATWCGPCREEMPALERLSRSLSPTQYLVVGLSLDKDRNLVREFALRHGVTFPLAIDPEGRLTTKLLAIDVVPLTLIIGPDGRLAERIEGGFDWNSATARRRIEFAISRTPANSAGKAHSSAGAVIGR